MQWRVGAFEIMDEDSGELIFSKLKLGQYTSPNGDGSRPPEEERAAEMALEVLLDDVEDLLETAEEDAAGR